MFYTGQRNFICVGHLQQQGNSIQIQILKNFINARGKLSALHDLVAYDKSIESKKENKTK